MELSVRIYCKACGIRPYWHLGWEFEYLDPINPDHSLSFYYDDDEFFDSRLWSRIIKILEENTGATLNERRTLCFCESCGKPVARPRSRVTNGEEILYESSYRCRKCRKKLKYIQPEAEYETIKAFVERPCWECGKKALVESIDFPEFVTHAQPVCSLRFCGYEYARESGNVFDFMEPVRASLRLHEDQNKNLTPSWETDPVIVREF